MSHSIAHLVLPFLNTLAGCQKDKENGQKPVKVEDVFPGMGQAPSQPPAGEAVAETGVSAQNDVNVPADADAGAVSGEGEGAVEGEGEGAPVVAQEIPGDTPRNQLDEFVQSVRRVEADKKASYLKLAQLVSGAKGQTASQLSGTDIPEEIYSGTKAVLQGSASIYSAECWKERVTVEEGKKNWKGALGVYGEALEGDMKACWTARLGQIPDGDPKKKEAYQKLLELDPENVSVSVALGDIFAKEGNKEEAVEYYVLAKSFATANAEKDRIQGKIKALLAGGPAVKPAVVERVKPADPKPSEPSAVKREPKGGGSLEKLFGR